MWILLAVTGAACVLTGWLPGDEARSLALDRGGPVLGFLVAITVLSELAQRAGVFDAAAQLCARAARGSVLALFALVAALGVTVTIGMSLDTTAVLLTPVVLTLTKRLGLRPEPFAVLTVWLANTASLLLPVSNLTNLLAVAREHLSAVSFTARTAPVAVTAVVVSVGYLALVYRRDLRERYEPPAPSETASPQAPDRPTFWVCALACLALAPGVLAGAPPWAVATPCAAAAVIVFAVRRRHELHWSLLPWRIVVFTQGLFLSVATVARHGLSGLLSEASGHSLLATVAVAAGASNTLNNLPAYLAIEPTIPTGATPQLLAVLVGTNTGPLVLMWGSLATLLWRERCRSGGFTISPTRFAAIGLGGVPLVLLACWGALLVTA